MIAKILSSSSTFNGVNYNTTKIEKGVGELMLVANFGSLQGLPNLRPEDYKNYLKMISATSSKISLPQFHAVLSCKGTEYNKEELTAFGVDWMAKMGYGKQPFLVVFHNDTDNNHVHLVSVRVDQNTGKKISDSFERLRAYEAVQSILNLENTIKSDIEKVKEFSFSTEAQLKLLLEKLGYVIKDRAEKVDIIKYGRIQGSFSKNEIQALTKENSKDKKRIAQVKAIILKYQKSFNAELTPVFAKMPGGVEGELISYDSKLSQHLREKFGLDIVFHFSNEKKPYGYTLIDNANKNVFKGSEILPLKHLITNSIIHNEIWIAEILENLKEDKLGINYLDEQLNRNGFHRKRLLVYDNQMKLAFKIEKSDFDILLNNCKNLTFYRVHSEKEKSLLATLLNVPESQIVIETDLTLIQNESSMYSTLLMAALNNYSTLEEGLTALSISLIKSEDRFFIFDSRNNIFLQIDNILHENNGAILSPEFHHEITCSTDATDFSLFIAVDVDDEAIHGRNRRRKGMARTNTR